MTRRTLLHWIFIIMAYLIVLIALALYLSGGYDPDAKSYRVLKDLIPLLLALPTAWLASVLQRRASFLTTLQALYRDAVASVQSAIQYTHKPSPTQTDFAEVQKQTSTTIELFRSSFRNLEESNASHGVFPFEALKTVTEWIDYSGFGENSTLEKRTAARRAILELWQNRIRKPVLNELDRETPTAFDSRFWQSGDSRTLWRHPPQKSGSLPNISSSGVPVSPLGSAVSTNRPPLTS
jgi:hypothetical protein